MFLEVKFFFCFWFRFSTLNDLMLVELKRCIMTSDEDERSHISKGTIAGVATGCSFLVLILAGLGFYALRQKRRAEQAISLSKPFGTSCAYLFTMHILLFSYDSVFLISSEPASWASSGKDSGGAPQLKGARWFSYEELKKCTSNFSDSNQIGSGGYGKVTAKAIFCMNSLPEETGFSIN